MNKLISIKFLLSLLLLFTFTVHAQSEYSFTEYVTLEGVETLTIPHNQSIFENSSFQFMKIRLTQKMIDKINSANAEMRLNGGELNYSTGIYRFYQSPSAVEIGMANVPVLDQGAYGTCVTFAATASLNARFGLGDYIDQQCSLALDLSLGNNYWQGAGTANQVILPLKKYGFIPKNKCFGIIYPNDSQLVNLNNYYFYSDKSYSSIMNTINSKADLHSVIAAVDSGRRVTIGFAYTVDFPTRIKYGNGYSDTYNAGGLWACQQPSSSINHCTGSTSGHEVIVTGYDNRQQLLKIRNSWGRQNGDQGEYYMTYSYFNAMAFDQTIIQ